MMNIGWMSDEWMMKWMMKWMNDEWMMYEWWMYDEWMMKEWLMNNEWMMNEWMNNVDRKWVINRQLQHYTNYTVEFVMKIDE